jgi:hypothetical protein
MIKKGKSYNLYGFSSYSPNLIRPAFVILKSSPFIIHIRIFSVNVLTLEQKNIFQVNPNDQKVLGFEISYANKLPPIGLPKAAETPAAAPAAAISLLKCSF